MAIMQKRDNRGGRPVAQAADETVARGRRSTLRGAVPGSGRGDSGPPAQIQLAPAAARQAITVRFSGVPDIAGNWIAIVPEGAPETNLGAYVSARGIAGEVMLPGQAAGRYEIRFFVEQPRRVLIARLAVTIE